MFKHINKAFTLVEVLVVLAIIGILSVLLIGGCQFWYASHVTHGTVVSKCFEPEHVEYTTQHHTVGKMSWTTQIPHTVPDTYTIGLRGEYDGSEYTRIVNVDRQSYVLIKVGQKLDINDLPLTPTAEESNERF